MSEERIMAFIRSRKESDQQRQIMHHLFFLGEITQAEATERYGITRLADVIYKLRRRQGFVIKDRTEHGLNRWGRKVVYAVYYL